MAGVAEILPIMGMEILELGLFSASIIKVEINGPSEMLSIKVNSTLAELLGLTFFLGNLTFMNCDEGCSTITNFKSVVSRLVRLSVNDSVLPGGTVLKFASRGDDSTI